MSSKTQLRLRIYIPQRHLQEPILSRLITDYGLSVTITGALLTPGIQPGRFDLELRGTLQQLQGGLSYLESIDVKLISKANSAGDGWHC